MLNGVADPRSFALYAEASVCYPRVTKVSGASGQNGANKLVLTVSDNAPQRAKGSCHRAGRRSEE